MVLNMGCSNPKTSSRITFLGLTGFLVMLRQKSNGKSRFRGIGGAKFLDSFVPKGEMSYNVTDARDALYLVPSGR